MLALLLLGPAGCGFRDFRMEDFSFRQMNFEDFRDPENPLEVVRHSKDGALRARALRCLTEPLANGGSQKDQDVIVAVLNFTAANDSQPLCRMAAIDVMRKFRDERVVDGLKEAYYHAGSFNADVATVLRCQTLQALGETGHKEAVRLLVTVLKEPPAEGPDQDRQLKLDERIAAARALGNFKQSEAAWGLVAVLRKDEDVALRARAHESLVAITGKDLPADADAWTTFLNDPGNKEAQGREPSWTDRLFQLTGLK
jgi:hypothetical protein